MNRFTKLINKRLRQLLESGLLTKFLMDEIMPLVWQKRPNVKVWIVGKDPAPEIQAWHEHPHHRGRLQVRGRPREGRVRGQGQSPGE